MTKRSKHIVLENIFFWNFKPNLSVVWRQDVEVIWLHYSTERTGLSQARITEGGGAPPLHPTPTGFARVKFKALLITQLPRVPSCADSITKSSPKSNLNFCWKSANVTQYEASPFPYVELAHMTGPQISVPKARRSTLTPAADKNASKTGKNSTKGCGSKIFFFFLRNKCKARVQARVFLRKLSAHKRIPIYTQQQQAS